MTIIECTNGVFEVRESASEVLRRLQNCTISSRHSSRADEPAAGMGSFQVMAIDNTPVIVQADSVLFVRDA
jgi:negative regulator of replication initiation